MKGKIVKKITRWMYIIHRYLGFALSLLFLMWFLSGFVMMYKSFPYLNEEEYNAKTESINLSSTLQTPEEIANRHHLEGKVWRELKLVNVNARPVYIFTNTEGNLMCYYADSGDTFNGITATEAREIVHRYNGNSSGLGPVEVINELDQWIPRTRFLPYLPAYKVYDTENNNTVFYVSSVTGEIFQKLDSTDKFWAWLGAIPHWIYFKDLRIHGELWSNTIIVLSGLGVLMCLAGIFMGIVRVKKRRKNALDFTPYKKVWFKWHHYTGFVFGVFVFTWILSGLFSMNPMSWSPSLALNSEASSIWQGGNISPETYTQRLNIESQSIVSVSYKQFAGIAYGVYTLKNSSYGCYVFDSSNTNGFSQPQLVEQIKLLHPKDMVAAVQLLTQYDAYYYDKHHKLPLPVLKVRMADANETTYYIDTIRARVLKRYEAASRLNRWLYHGLHSLDFPFLYNKRPLWDVIMFILLIGGTAASFTGCMLTYKWLLRKFSKGHRKFNT